jgi:malate dehydrogenase (oxaloacetate-decarboxylating)
LKNNTGGIVMDYAKESLRLHGEWKGKIEVISKVPVNTKEDLSLAYTPGSLKDSFA